MSSGVSRAIVGSSLPSRSGVVRVLIAFALFAPGAADAVTFEGDLTYASDYIYRGISQTGGRSAGQIDLHVGSADGTFVGVFASTIDRLWRREYTTVGWDYALEEYLGHRFDLSPSWSTTVTGVNYQYKHGNAPINNDFQEVSVA